MAHFSEPTKQPNAELMRHIERIEGNVRKEHFSHEYLNDLIGYFEDESIANCVNLRQSTLTWEQRQKPLRMIRDLQRSKRSWTSITLQSAILSQTICARRSSLGVSITRHALRPQMPFLR